MTDERLIYEILAAVSEIPPGRVATYGQIARLIGGWLLAGLSRLSCCATRACPCGIIPMWTCAFSGGRKMNKQRGGVCNSALFLCPRKAFCIDKSARSFYHLIWIESYPLND